MPGVGLIRSKLRPSRWLSPKSKQSFTKRRLPITASSKSFSARCANSVSKSSSDRHRESANAPAANIPKVPYLSAIPLESFAQFGTVPLRLLFQRHSYWFQLQALRLLLSAMTEFRRRNFQARLLDDLAYALSKNVVAPLVRSRRDYYRR